MAADGEGLDQESSGDQWQPMVRQEIENYMGSMLGLLSYVDTIC